MHDFDGYSENLFILYESTLQEKVAMVFSPLYLTPVTRN